MKHANCRHREIFQDIICEGFGRIVGLFNRLFLLFQDIICEGFGYCVFCLEDTITEFQDIICEGFGYGACPFEAGWR